jgi:tetratricopeptide (TPR) repeat protein
LAGIEERRRERAPGYAELPVGKIEFARGNLLFWYRDLDPALADLTQVTKKADSVDLNTAVLAWLRVGQIQDLEGRHSEAIEAYREAMKTAPHSGAAEEAHGYIKKPYHRGPAK